jgi:uncharacterized protein
MNPLVEMETYKIGAIRFAAEPEERLVVEALRAEDETEVMAFLNERSSHTFGMTGFIRTNGLVSPHNCGVFYSCRDRNGQLQGVALVGRYILLETRSDAAIKALAVCAQSCKDAHMLLGDQDTVETFWNYYQEEGQKARRYCRELLLEQHWPIEVREAVPGLRLATLDDLELVVPAHAQSAFDESGVDPLQENAEGFTKRCARRIEQGQTWVWVENGRLIFKAEVLTDTADVAYLEGVWVDPEARGKSFGLRCISQLTRHLLGGSRTVCLLVNEKFQTAQAFYNKAGYKFVANYDTIFLKKEVN